MGEGGHGDIKGLFSQDEGPVRLEESTHAHTVNTRPTEEEGTMFSASITKGLLEDVMDCFRTCGQTAVSCMSKNI